MDINKLWHEVLEYLKRELSVFAYNEYFISIEPLDVKDGVVYLKVQNEIQKNILKNTYTVLLLTAFRDIDESVTNIEFVLNESFGDDVLIGKKPNFTYQPKLNEKYTFEEFIVGQNNRLAHAAAIGVAKEPTKYNPLFIYGGVGLGKTHLMQAIAHYVRKEDPTKKIVYLSSEQFTNEFIDAIMNKSNLNFRQKYRNVDFLLIDDIQFLSGKEGTQEEFFHTFNELFNSNKQIIITSDRPPKEIPELEDRLRSRFEWGLICDIQPPDFETRCAILKAKAEKEHFDISQEIIEFLAERVNSNIRELEGVLIKIKALMDLGEIKELNVDQIKENLKHVVLKEKRISVELIIKTLCSFYDVNKSDLLGARRTKQIAYIRQVGMYVTRELTDLSLPNIGDAFGGRDHTTVLYACDKIKKDMEDNDTLKTEIDKLSSTIKNKNN